MSFGQTLARMVGAVMGGVLILWGLGGIVPAHADNHAVARVYGKTYGEWTAKWWQWAHSLPAATNPLRQEGMVDCSHGQSGPVWFLAGTLGGGAERTCTIPHRKALLFPLVNADFVNVPGDCGRAEGCTEAEKRQLLYEHINPGVPARQRSRRGAHGLLTDHCADAVPHLPCRHWRR